jgi:opacity protein-like surface antigen
MTHRAMRLALLAPALAVAGCGWLPDAYTGCDEAQPYEAAKDQPALRVPEGADLPDTRGSLKVPEVKTPQLPRQPGTCLEHPPSFATAAGETAAAQSSSAAVAGPAVTEPAGTSRPLPLAMESGSPWQARLGANYQPTTDVDFDGGSTAEFNTSTSYLMGLSYALSRHFEIGANFTYDERDFEAALAGDEPDEFFHARGDVETMGLVFDLSYYFLTGRIRPFVSTGAGWNFVDTNIPTAPPQVGCWWNPWSGYSCEDFEETRNVDGFAYQAGAGVNVRVTPTFAMTGAYLMNWVDYPKADGTPMFDAIQLILHWAF